MMDPIQALLQSAQLPTNNFPVTSRYHHIETAVFDRTEEQSIVYLKRRFVPPPEQYFIVQNHIVQQRERLDNITATYLMDPEQFWQLADANLAMKPHQLTEVSGRKLHIPQGTAISGL